MSKSIKAKDPKNNKEKAKDVIPYAPFPCVVFFYRSVEQAGQEYGKNESSYNCTFGFDTYIPILMGKSARLLGDYNRNENRNIITKYVAKNKKGEEKEISLYPKEEEIPDIKKVNKIAGHENIEACDFETSYKVPVLHIPSDTTTIELTVVVQMPKDKEVNKTYKEYKKGKGEDTEAIYFALACRNERNVPLFLDKKLIYQKNEASGLSLDVTSIDYPIKNSKGTYTLTITKQGQRPFEYDDLSIIAYYLKPVIGDENKLEADKDEKKPTHREVLIGQVNIIPTAVHILKGKIEEYVESMGGNEDIGLELDPQKIVLDIQFVNVINTDINPPRLSRTARELTNALNNIYRQIGIQFRLKMGFSPEGQDYINLHIPDNEMCAPDGTPYNKGEYTFRDKKEEVTVDRTIYTIPRETFIDELGGRKTMNYYGNVENNIELRDLLKDKLYQYLFRHTRMKNNDSYKTIEKKALEGIDKEKEKEREETIKGLHEKLKEYLNSKLFTVYILNDIHGINPRIEPYDIPGSTEEYTRCTFVNQAFGIIGGVEAIFCNSVFHQIEYFFPHELGHCLGLYHTFLDVNAEASNEITYQPVIPYKFEAENWDCKGCSYGNIMDYIGSNTNFKASTIANFQLDTILTQLGGVNIQEKVRTLNLASSYGNLFRKEEIKEKIINLYSIF